MKHGTMKMMLFAVVAVFSVNVMAASGKPLKVYILAGQSNMQGHAKDSTIPHMAGDPQTKPLHDKMVDENGKPRIYTDVSVAAFSSGQKAGPLTVGFGAGLEDTDVLGTELAFGITMHESLKEPILIIKTAWGGKDLYCDFRPPSAGKPTYTIPTGKGGPREAGKYYKLMVEHVKSVLENPKKFCPSYSPEDGYEIAGFVWFQGWNDMCASGEIYPKGSKDRFAEYSRLLGCFIRDVRKEFDAPSMPFVIGVMGVGGNPDEPHPFREAMAAPAELPEFKGNVVAVHTAKFWDDAVDEALSKMWHGRKKLSYYVKKASPPGSVVQKAYPKAYAMKKDYWDTPPKDRKAMSKEELTEYLDAYRRVMCTPEDEALAKQGSSNAGYHYLGSAKILSRIGEGFAQALLEK